MPAKKRKIVVDDESNIFGDIVSDMHMRRKVIPDRDLEAELFKTTHQKDSIDDFEKRVGIQAKTKKALNIAIKARLFKLNYAADLALYNKLLNDPKYRILQMDKTFTGEGEFLAFVHYADNQDLKEKEQPTNE